LNENSKNRIIRRIKHATIADSTHFKNYCNLNRIRDRIDDSIPGFFLL
jgi:hypothetical protein